jgi:hypothetical protein
MNKTLILILTSGLLLACSGDSKEDSAETATPDVVTAEDADAAATAAMEDVDSAKAELDKLEASLED